MRDDLTKLGVTVLGLVAAVGLILASCEARPEPTIEWDAFWALRIDSGEAPSTYSRYTKSQCEEAKRIVNRQRGVWAVCVPVPLTDSTTKPHDHDSKTSR